MSQLFFLLLILACPLMMMFMMRGMHGGAGHDAGDARNDPRQVVDTTAQDARIAQLEREVARLRATGGADDTPDPHFAETLQQRLDRDLAESRR